MNSDRRHIMTDSELKEAIELHVGPIERKAYEARKIAGAAAAHAELRETIMVKAAQLSGRLPANDAAKGKTPPADLARRAAEIQAETVKEGRSLSNIESVQLACKEAGIPLR